MEPLPCKRQRGLYELDDWDDSDQTKRACTEQSGPETASRLTTPNWSTLTPSCASGSLSTVVPSASPSHASTLFDNQDEGAYVSETLEETEYCCFGEVLLDAVSSSTDENNGLHIPVEIRFTPNNIKLHHEASSKYLGFLDCHAIAELVQRFQVTLTATLWHPKRKTKKNTNQQPGEKSVVHVVIYGLRKDMDDIGSFLEDCNLYLQHPTEYDNRVEYANPQYLLRPGSRMPKVHDAAFHAMPSQESSDRILDEGSKGELLRVFDAADGPSLFAEVKPSPRLRTPLQKHQQKALAMMAEKECGLIDNTSFQPLWETSTRANGARMSEIPFLLTISLINTGPRYRHVVTGRIDDSQPTPVLGGILADDMGLGKTLSTLALIAWFLDTIDTVTHTRFRGPRATLIITPNSTIPGWLEQIESHLLPNQIRIVLYHGPCRGQIASSLHEHDIVLTTYGTLRSEWASKKDMSPLFSGEWARVVLDEAHHIRDRSAQVFKAASAIRAIRRWCLTGTPIQNRLDDYGALLSFIGVTSFTSKSMFEFWIGAPIRQHRPEGLPRLKKLVAATCLRRTKGVVWEQLNLPRRTTHECVVQLDQHDREIYDFFKRGASALMTGVLSADTNDSYKAGHGNILPIINTLRLICNHGESLLPKPALRAWTQKRSLHGVCGSDGEDIRKCYSCGISPSSNGAVSDFACSHFLCSRCADINESHQATADHIVCPRCGQDEVPEVGSGNGHGTTIYQPSAKVRALLDNLRSEQRVDVMSPSGRPPKSVVFTFWTRMLDLLEIALFRSGFRFERIDGQKSLAQRASALSSFRNDIDCTVMIATIGSVGEG
ncbi:hypothetical protein ACJZ2D_005481 [Fusarium nematophilum]